MPNPTHQEWDRFWNRSASQRFSQISWSKRRILEVLNRYVVVGQKALDAGCGSGFFSKYFCDRGMPTVSLDYADSALAMARELTQGKTKLIKANLLHDWLSTQITERFDLIFSDGLLEHFTVQQQTKILQNLISVLSPTGVIVTFVPNRWSPWELIRPLYMPGIEEKPFILKELKDVHQGADLKILDSGGVNVFPWRVSPEKFLGKYFGMLLYTVTTRK